MPTGFVGTERTFAWDAGLKRLPNLTWDDVRTLLDLGHDVGSHTVQHPNLARLSPAETRRELRESRATLEDELGRAVRWLAYPFGGRHHLRPDQL